MVITTSERARPSIEVDIWTDVVCPWCYIGKRRFERAGEIYDGPLEVRFRSFELNPERPRNLEQTLPEMLAAKYRVSLDQAMAMNQRVTDAAAGEGLDFRLDLARPANTFDAHRLIHLARAHELKGAQGLQSQMVERLKSAYFLEGKRIDDRSALLDLGAEVGLDRDEAAAVLESDRYESEVRADEESARQLDIHGVPFFVIDGRYGLSGAQDPELIARVLARAAAESQTSSVGGRE